MNILLLLIEERENFFAPIKPFLLYALGEKMLWLPEKRVKPKPRLTAVLMVFGSRFKFLACLLMLIVGSSVILSLRVLRKTLLLFLLWPSLPGDLFVSLPSFLACWICCTVLSVTPMILAISFWGVCASKRSIMFDVVII